MSRLNFNEKFIDHEIAELCKEYDLIQGSNKNIARITGDFIDGLKPVQRRALYVMYLKDQGKSFRKLATISGDVFGRVHPHSPVAIEDAIVNIAQPWHNMIPLIQGEGNFGCHDDQTEVLTRDGWKMFSDITKDDLLASVNPENGDMIFEHPTNIFKYEYNGEMVVGKHHALDFKVTPNHNMLVSKYDSHKSEFKKFEFVQAGNLTKYVGLMNRFFHRAETSVKPIILAEEKISNGNILPYM